MNRLLHMFLNDRMFRDAVHKAARATSGLRPKSDFATQREYGDYIDAWLMEEVSPPWPSDCNPEQCPHVAQLFSNIAQDLVSKGGFNKAAAWTHTTFEEASKMVSGNADALSAAYEEE